MNAPVVVKIVPDHRPFNRAMREAKRLAENALEAHSVHPTPGLEDFLSLFAVVPEELRRIECHVCRADGANKTVVLFHPCEWLENVIATGRALNGDVAGKAAGHPEISLGCLETSKVERVGEGGESAFPGEAPDTEDAE